MVTLRRMQETDWSKVLGWPGYRVYRHEIDEVVQVLFDVFPHPV